MSSPDQLNRIVEGTSIKGDVITDSNFRMDGFLEGTLRTTGKLVVGTTGRIEGEILCANADIEGEVVGNITVDGLLILKATAKVKGNIVAGKIGVENGAAFNGNCAMGGTPVETTALPKVEEESESELVY
ncbi:polymer-forming cytoskeletal protein [Paracrocinitomix mangrovi]|uniref:bactofilin family protein n=1 Tax=Paracrocinitomix mangrovi TaxID=2862509 RepID=UPI001EDB3DFA|nr:polymer-forming cytoskeletal protein [Paracrocinitomix mangrovi]UKN00370.1 polymer-forming cytoskeletal protein [Paracrocinitomix mangrovi]